MPELKPLSLVFADDHEIIREGLVSLCSLGLPRSRIVGQCSDGLAALHMIQNSAPDFAIIDLNMPKLDGLELIRKLREAKHPCKLVVFSMTRDERTVCQALSAGANGYLPKDGPSRHLLDAIRFIQDGGIYISPLFRQDVLARDFRHASDHAIGLLSAREGDVFYHLIQGMRAKEIAQRLNLSPKTIDTYRANIMKKLGIDSLAGLVRFAIRNRLVEA